ncbi:hypothetical protein GGR51DRAFT_330017 [Nemania sp. FL0031]|nr:hypothetical protein GGR51DRAFT_330017 [Nemania sp. FL0031]
MLPGAAVIATPTRNSETSPRYAYQGATVVASILHLSRYCARLSSRGLVFWLWSSGLVLRAATRILQVTRSIVRYSFRLPGRAIWLLWDNRHSRRFRKKMEFEFFLLILGGGHFLFLLLFWPGWIIIGAVALAILPFLE